MKKVMIIKTAMCLFLLTSLVGCKDMLQEYNPSGTTAEAVYTTPTGYDALIAASYSYTRYWYGKEEGMGVSEFGTDLWTAGSESMIASSGLAADNRPVILYKSLNPANNNITRLWRTMYAGLNICNAGIKIATDDGAFKPEKKKTAELYFLRAFYLFHIVETWGGVHFTTEPTTKPVTTANRTDETVFYAQIVSDLQKAINDLDNSKSPGRANKHAARAFMARVMLTRGYKTFGSSQDFTNAKLYADSVIALGGYALMPKYKDLWDMSKQNNNEVIWSVNYSTDFTNTSDVYDPIKNPYGYGYDILSAGGNPTSNRGSNNTHALFVPTYDRGYSALGSGIMMKRDVRNGWPFARVKPTRYLLDLFDGSKDARYKGSFQTVWILNYSPTSPAGFKLIGKQPYKDTALVIDKSPTPSANYYTYDVYSSYNPDGSSASSALTGIGNQLFPALIKHMDSTRSASPSDQANGNVQSAKDVFVIRLAEMYMIGAEASWKLGNAQDAADYINVLRTRAALPGQTAAMQITSANISDDFILDERAREFAGEYMRWFDLKRTGKLATRLPLYNPDVVNAPNGGFQSYHVLRPIPQTQIDVVTNKAEFYQNNGY